MEPGLLAVSYTGLILIMLATYYSNDYFDYEGDVINRDFNRFSGGCRARALMNTGDLFAGDPLCLLAVEGATIIVRLEGGVGLVEAYIA